MSRTDLACEIATQNEKTSGITLEESTIDGVGITRVLIQDKASERTGKSPGEYITLLCKDGDADAEISALSSSLSQILESAELNKLEQPKCLIVGLGNENITPDSLGVRAAGRILATGHFCNSESRDEYSELGLNTVYVIQPGVMAQTGLESAYYLELLAKGINPDFLIVIDSLACNGRERLGKTLQITDAGISPGSGVKNERKEFSRKLFGVPVIAIGVPTVIDMGESGQTAQDSQSEPFMLVPRNIDVIINHFARVISTSVNRVLNPNLNDAEIEMLLM
ncbi:MAG: GPR endopeptidase [Oscillospiraceae bacterium]|nr:GPR endopeptidase [Oscillospiraceae bacterium]